MFNNYQISDGSAFLHVFYEVSSDSIFAGTSWPFNSHSCSECLPSARSTCHASTGSPGASGGLLCWQRTRGSLGWEALFRYKTAKRVQPAPLSIFFYNRCGAWSNNMDICIVIMCFLSSPKTALLSSLKISLFIFFYPPWCAHIVQMFPCTFVCTYKCPHPSKLTELWWSQTLAVLPPRSSLSFFLPSPPLPHTLEASFWHEMELRIPSILPLIEVWGLMKVKRLELGRSWGTV